MRLDERARLMAAGRDGFNRGEFYEAHELWEEVWQEIDDPDWTWIQGLIQIATGFHKLNDARRESAERSLRRGLERTEDAPPWLDGVDVIGARRAALDVLAALERGDKPRAEPGILRVMDKRSANVLGKHMAYVEVGQGDPIVFLHGNPTSSFLWRNVIPHVADRGRCIAPDLIGMGDSDKLDDSGPDRYTFVEHRRYLDELLEQLGVASNVAFVIHDWGSALGFDWANRHRDAVRGICYMEAIVQPVTWADWPEAAKGIFQAFRSPAGEDMILERNLFVEAVLPAAILRKLSDEEMAEYRRPFRNAGEDRRPTLTWPRQIPIEGEPADVHEIVTAYGKWLAESDVPKLFVNADPGAILLGEQREFCRSWPNQTEITVSGNHFIQEDSADAIGKALADWLPAE